MNAVSKNIRRLRTRDGISQETLAEKLSVTRQAVSNWETGKTQPDINTLVAIASAFGTDVNTLIYGKTARRDKSETVKYRRLIFIAGAVNVVFILLEIFLVPHFKDIATGSFNPLIYYVYIFFARPLWFSGAAVLFLSILSLWKDIRITNQTFRKIILGAGLFLIGFYYLCAANLFAAVLPFGTLFLIKLAAVHHMLLFIPGTVLFFGFNK